MLRSTIRNASLSRASLRAPFSTTPLRFARPRKNPFYSPPVQPAKRRGRPTDPVIPHPINPEDRIALPDRLEWRSFFSAHAKERISVSNEQTAAEAAEAFVPAGSRDKIIIEAFPGEWYRREYLVVVRC
jgi:transcription factor 1